MIVMVVVPSVPQISVGSVSLFGWQAPLELRMLSVVLLMVVVGGLAGFFVVPMNALLQHRGHILMGAGHSIAVQNFNENLSILVMTGLYALLIRWGLSINTLIALFGILVAIAMLL